MFERIVSGGSKPSRTDFYDYMNGEDIAAVALERRLLILRQLALILLIATVGALLITVYTAVSRSAPAQLIYLIPILTGVPCFGLSLWLSRKGATSARATAASYILLITIIGLLMVYAAPPTGISPILSGFFIIPMLVGVMELPMLPAFTAVVAGGGLLAVFCWWQESAARSGPIQAPTYSVFDSVITWVFLYSLVAAGILMVTRRLRQAVKFSEAQAGRVTQLLEALKQTTRFGASLGHNLSSVTAELNATFRQQTNNAQEQVATLSQITAGLEELSETAAQIASNAQSARKIALETVGFATRVKEAGDLVVATAQEGSQAVNETIGSIEQIRLRIEELDRSLVYLAEQNQKVGTIIDIIEEIASETHLLALNASIEAVGSGGSEVATVQGERFSVIAQEIKHLSDRSRKATKDVRVSISGMDDAVRVALKVGEEGKQETAIAQKRSEVTGPVIARLSQVISAGTGSAQEILTAAYRVKERTEEIGVATDQQRSATQQLLLSMRIVSNVSGESAVAATQLSETAKQLDEQLTELNMVLAGSASGRNNPN